MRSEKVRRLRVDSPQGVSGYLNKEARFSFNCASPLKERQASIALPFRSESYASGELFSIFAMNKPEGFLLNSLRNRFEKIMPVDDMSLLKITGKNQIGRLNYLDETDEVTLTRARVSLDELRKSKASVDLFEHLVNVCFDSGISGFQPKVMVAEAINSKVTAVTPNLIVKSSGVGYPHLTENEFLCMSVAKECGFSVPEFWMSDDNGLFISKRFDVTQDGERLGLEDICVVSNKTAEEKYHGSYEGVARIIETLTRDGQNNSDLDRLFDYIALSVLLKNGDAHLKNFSILYAHPGKPATLSPLYDVVTTTVYDIGKTRMGMSVVDNTLALNLRKTKQYPDIDTLLDFGRKVCFVSNPVRVIEKIEEAKIKVLSEHCDRIDPDFFVSMKEAWGLARS